MNQTRDPAAVRFGPFLFEPLNGRLLRAGADLPVPPRALAILGCLLERPGLLVSKQHLLDQVWKDAFVSETSLSEAVSVLRQALADDAQEPSYIQTVPRRGYRFIADVEPVRPFDGAAAAHDRTSTNRTTDESPETAGLWLPWLPWLACFVGGLAVGMLALGLQGRPLTADRPVVRFVDALPAGLTLAGPEALAASADGRVLAAVLEDARGERAVHVRPLDAAGFQQLPGSEGAHLAFVSTDGRRVGIAQGERLRVMVLPSGPWTTVGRARLVRGATFLDNDDLIVAAEADGGLRRVPARGGDAFVVARPRRGDGEDVLTSPVPLGGAGLVFSATRPGRDSLLYGWPASSSTPRLLAAGSQPQWVAPAHLVYRRGARAYAAVLLPPDWSVPHPVLLPRLSRFDGDSSWAATGETMVRTPACGDCARPSAVPRDAPPIPLAFPAGDVETWWLSPDGGHVLAIVQSGDDRQVWRITVASGASTMLDRGHPAVVVGDAQGGHVVAADFAQGAWRVRPLEGTGWPAGAEPIRADVPMTPTAVTAGGEIWFHASTARGDLDVWRVRPGETPRPVLHSPHDEWMALPSPDGRWLAHVSNARGEQEFVLRDLTDGQVVGAWTAAEARWHCDGATLLLRRGRWWQSVDVGSAARPLVARDEVPEDAVLPSRPPRPTTLEVVRHWARDVRQQAPVAPRPVPVVR